MLAEACADRFQEPRAICTWRRLAVYRPEQEVPDAVSALWRRDGVHS
jgi:hypothetical protein